VNVKLVNIVEIDLFHVKSIFVYDFLFC